MKNYANKIISFIFALFFCFIFIFSNISFSYAKAEEKRNYTTVMEDLQSDEKFNILDYPAMNLDYYKEINSDLDILNDQESMEIFQIAESLHGELFLYIYQPTDSELDLIANSILMSCEYTADGNNIQGLEIYYLELISTSTVFDKYKVKDFTVSTDEHRYYNIVTLYRDYNPIIDTIAGGVEEEGNEKGVKVAQQWYAYSENGNVVYEKGFFKTVEVEITFTGSVRFENGFQLFPALAGNYEKYDAWFVVFDVEDYIVSRIYDADLVYRKCDVEDISFGLGLEPGITKTPYSEDIPVTLKETDIASFEGEGWFAKDYKWNRISSASDFLEKFEDQGVSLSEETEEALEKGQWVFAFLETEYVLTSNDNIVKEEYTDVLKVTIIRMHFLDILGQEYNLGVVSDRVNPDNNPDGSGPGCDRLKLQQILALICLIFLLFILQITGILPLLGKAIVWIITAPFKFIKWIIDKLRGK